MSYDDDLRRSEEDCIRINSLEKLRKAKALYVYRLISDANIILLLFVMLYMNITIMTNYELSNKKFLVGMSVYFKYKYTLYIHNISILIRGKSIYLLLSRLWEVTHEENFVNPIRCDNTR